MQCPVLGKSHPSIYSSWRCKILLWLKNGLGFLSRYQLVTGLSVLLSEDNAVLGPDFTETEGKRNHQKKPNGIFSVGRTKNNMEIVLFWMKIGNP